MSATDLEPTTVVVFRRWPKSQGGDVLAFFPYAEVKTLGGCPLCQS